jgi:hypothetical protein
MKVVVETRNGPRAGHRVWLSARQQVRFGSSEWAEFCIPDDVTMADVQFALECGGRACRLRNLSGERPLFVNGLRVEQHTLVSGDVIRAGDTEFLVSIQLGNGEIPETLPLASRTNPTEKTNAKYTAVGDGDLVCLSGERAKCPEEEIAALLKQEHGMYLLLHQELASRDEWETVQTSDGGVLIEQAPVANRTTTTTTPTEDAGESTAAEQAEAPGQSRKILLIGPSTTLDRIDMIRRNWASGAVTVLFSGREEVGVRQLVGERPLLLLHPADLAGRLLRWRGQVVDSELDGLAAVFLPMSETHWGIFASPKFRPVWERIGLDEAPEHHRDSWSRFDTFWLSVESASLPISGLGDGQTLAAG